MKWQTESSPLVGQQARPVDSEQPMLAQSMDQLVSGDFNARWSASKALKSMGDIAHPSLIEIVESQPQDTDLLGFIADILGHRPSPDAILALVHLLKHCDDDDVRETVILTLAKQGPDCIQELLAYLNHPHLQGTVLKALIQMNHPAAIEGFLSCIDHHDAEIRAQAFEGVGQFHQAAIAPVLIQGLQDTHAKVRGICVKALGLREQSDVNESLITAISPRLYDLNETVCHLTAKTLGRLTHPLAFEHLWHCLIEQSQPSTMTVVLIQALGWAGHSQGVDYLLRLLKMIVSQESPAFQQPWPSAVVLELIQTLTNLYDPQHSIAVERELIPLLTSKVTPFETIQVKQALTMAIAQLGQDHSIPHLISVLSIEDHRLRLHVIAALKQLNRDLSYKHLVAAAQDLTLDPTLTTGIAIALKEW